MATTGGWRRSRRRIGVVLAALVAVAVAAGCEPIHEYASGDYVVQAAQFRVHALTSGGTSGVEIRIRDCDKVEFKDSPNSPTVITASPLRPWSTVTDSKGVVVFRNAPRAPHTYPSPTDNVYPARYSVSDGDSAAGDSIWIGVSAARGPFRVTAGCTNQGSAIRAGEYDFTIGSCTTIDLVCGPVKGGAGSIIEPIA
ncbi:hypothetical protein [Aquihabitans sp. McL0605]|uniref:hypothetical protein n=1 Tax=Aquihabitans sp. McL0605 TaxID=3415671 RepID=UPI003CF6CBB8